MSSEIHEKQRDGSGANKSHVSTNWSRSSSRSRNQNRRNHQKRDKYRSYETNVRNQQHSRKKNNKFKRNQKNYYQRNNQNRNYNNDYYYKNYADYNRRNNQQGYDNNFSDDSFYSYAQFNQSVWEPYLNCLTTESTFQNIYPNSIEYNSTLFNFSQQIGNAEEESIQNDDRNENVNCVEENVNADENIQTNKENNLQSKVIDDNENKSGIEENCNENVSVPVNIKQEIIEEQFNNGNKTTINLVPLSFLLKQEYAALEFPQEQEENSERNDYENLLSTITSVASDQSKEIVNNSNNTRSQGVDPERISKSLLNRVVKMDRVNIKNVINNPTSKFDAALKIQARKKLHEEIRKQLRSMNLPGNNENVRINENLLEPDESIECGQIPDAILNEISKSLGIELSGGAGLHDENYLSEIDTASLLNTEDHEITPSIEELTKQKESEVSMISEKETASNNSKQTDLMTRIKTFEAIKSTTDKVIKKTSDDKNDQRSTITNEIQTKDRSKELNEKGAKNVNSSSSSSDSSDSSSDSDSSSSDSDSSSSSSSNDDRNGKSNHTTKSTTNTNKAKKQKILEDNVIMHFNTLTLPMMPVRERQKYEKQNFKNNTDTLIYILDYCLKKTETNETTLSSHRKKNLKKNLKSRNNEEVLQFLTQKIKEIFEKNKSKKTNSSKSKISNEKRQNTSKQRKNSNEKSITSTPTNSASDILNTSEKNSQPIANCNKNSVKRKYTRKSSKLSGTNDNAIKLPAKNKTSIRTNQISSVDCSSDNNNPSNRISKITNNLVVEKSSKADDDKFTQQNNTFTNKETFIDHKGINDCNKDVMTPAIEGMKDAWSASSSIGDGSNVIYSDKHGKEYGEIIQSRLDESDENADENRRITLSTSGSKNKIDEVLKGNEDLTNSICLKTKENESKDDDVEFISEENKVCNSSTNTEIVENNFITSELNEYNKMQRSWKSPGEKKCIQVSNCSSSPSPSSSLAKNTQTENEINNEFSQINSNFTFDPSFNPSSLDFNLPNFPTNVFDLSNQTESLRIASLIQQNKLSESVLNNLKEIDHQLMELHKRKMYIEAMILKLTKDKMLLDLSAMQLQNQKSLIINAALSNNSNNNNMNSPNNGNNSHLNINQLQTDFSVKTEQQASSGISATDLMTNMLSVVQEKGSFSSSNQRKRKHSPKSSTTISEDSPSKRNSKQSLQNSSTNSSVTNLNLTKSIHSENKEIGNNLLPERSSQNNFQMNYNENIKSTTSDGKIVQSSRNFSTNSNKVTAELKTKNSSEKSLSSSSMKPSEFENVNSLKNTKVNKIDTDDDDGDNYDDNDDENQDKSSIENELILNNDDDDDLESQNISNGIFENSKFPIIQLHVIGNYIIAASEDGNIYKFCLKSRKLISKFSKHTETVTQIYVHNNNFIYSISLDGYFKKTSLENFGLELQSKNLQEPLQCIDLQWNTAFIGSRWGNIFTYNAKSNKLSDTLLCSIGSAITALKATKEGARKILIVSSRGNQITFRDATSGLLLRTLEIPNGLNIYNILLNGDLLYCGSNKNEIHVFNFTTGAKFDVFICGNGGVTMKLFQNKLLFVGCYDGFVYALDKITGSQIGRFPGAGKMTLALDIVGDKIITSSKDNCVEIRDIPKYISALLK